MRFPRDVMKKTLLRPLILVLTGLFSSLAPAQLFQQPKVIPTGNWPAAVYSADINGDGYPDLIYIDQGATATASTLHVLLNDGRGNFAQSATFAIAGTSVAFGNFTGSGKVDIGWLTPDTLAPGNTFLRSHVAANLGNGTFAAPVSSLQFTVPDSFRAGYITGARLYTTGFDAFIVEDVQNNVVYTIQLYTSSSIGQGSTRTLPDGPGPIAVADLNGDGLLDFIVTGSPSSAQVFLNLGSNGFGPYGGPSFRFTGASGIHSLLIKDVNLDGKPDLIAEGANGHIDVFPGNGDGTFQTTSIGGTGPLNGLTGNGGHLIALGDYNHDGLLDALTATPAGISVLLGQGTQYLGLKGIYNAGPGGSGGPAGGSGSPNYVVADFNGDGNLDLALDSPEGIAILFGNHDGSLQTSKAFAAGQPAMSGALGHLTPSGSYTGGPLDAVVSTGSAQAQAFLGDGTGNFTPVGGAGSPTPSTPQNGTPGLWGVVHIGDFFDGFVDDIAITADGGSSAANGGVLIPLASTSPPSGLIYQRGNGDGTFATPLSVTGPAASQQTAGSPAPFYGVATVWPYAFPSAVFTRDAAAYRYTGDVGQTYPLLGSYTFGTQTTFTNHAHNLIAVTPTGLPATPIIVGQQDGDLFVFYGDLTFNAPLIGDLAVDGSVTTPGQITAPDISPTFPGMSTALGFRAFPGSAVINDLDKDGFADLIVAYDNLDADHAAPAAAHPNKIYIWYGSNNGKFLTSAQHPVNPVVLTPSRNYYQVAVADLNGDNIPDLILSDGYILSVQLGKGDGTFGVETHYLAGQGINTISVGDLRNSGHQDLVLADGGAVLSNPVANKEVLATNPDVNTGGVTVLLNLTTPLLVPTATLTASPEPSSYGSPFTINLTFSNTQPVPTGTATFFVDGIQACCAGPSTCSPTSLNGGAASCLFGSPNTLPTGAHTLTAVYSGDTNYQAATFTGTHVVSAATTSNSVVASPEPSVYGNSFTITATAAGPGTFQFSLDGSPIGTVTSTTNTASVTGPAYTTVGTHALTVLWTAGPSAVAVLITGTHQVTINPTVISLLLCVDNPGSLFPCGVPIGNTPLISPITLYYGQTLDGVATESASNLTGTITFYDGTTVFCTLNANLANGSNMCPPNVGNFHAGSRIVTATYSGDPDNAASTSNSIAVTVFPDITTAKLSSSLNPAVVGSTVTFTAVIAGNYAIPPGAVNFYDGNTLLGGGSLDPSGTASFTTSTLAVGSHPITVVFAGSSDFLPITSAILTQVITAVVVPPPPGTGFTFTVTPDPITIGAGATGALLATVTAQGSSTPPVALTCSGLPDETTCTFVTPILPAGGGATTLQFHVAAPHDCGSTTPYFIGSTDGPASPLPYTFAAIFFGAFATWRRSKLKKVVILAKPESLYLSLFLLLIALLSLASLSGCGHCTDLGVRPGHYTFTVTATPQGTSTTPAQSITIPLTVTIP